LHNITYFIIPEAAGRVAALEAGQVDLIPSPMVPTPDVGRLKVNPDIVIGESPMGMVRELRFATNQPPFDDIRLRQAIALVMDRDAICRIAMNNLDIPLYGLLAPVQGKYHVDLKDQWQPEGPDLAKANQLLDDAGWIMAADGWRYKEGTRLEWTTPASTAHEWHEAILTVLQPQLEEIGMKMNIQVVDSATWGESYRIITRWPEVGVGISRFGSSTPTGALNWYFVQSSQSQTDCIGWGPGPGTTPVTDFYTSNGDYDAELDAFVMKAKLANTEEEAVEAVHDAVTLLGERCWWILISNPLKIEAYSSKVVNYETVTFGTYQLILDVYVEP
jgi:ABC-type transport system substrate-binding protein